MDARHDKVTWVLLKVKWDRDHDEVLALVKTRCLRLCAEWPADTVHPGTPSGLDLYLNQESLSTVRQYRENVGAFEPIACERWCPATPS